MKISDKSPNSARALAFFLALLLVGSVVLSFTGCEKLEQFFGEEGNGDTPGEPDDPSADDDPIVDDGRTRGIYTFLLVREETDSDHTVKSVNYCALDLTRSSLSLMSVPAGLFISGSGANTLGELYSKTYRASTVSGKDRTDSVADAMKALSEFLEKEMLLPVDYYISVDTDGLASYIDSMGGLGINLTFPLTTSSGKTLGVGQNILNGTNVCEYLDYQDYSDDSSARNAEKNVLALLYYALHGTLSSRTISLHMIGNKRYFVTNVPAEDGTDIFFLRKLISISPDNWRICELDTSPVALKNGKYEVVSKKRSAERIDSFLKIYSSAIDASKFDPNGKLNDKTNGIVNSMYVSEITPNKIYTASEIFAGKLVIARK